MMWKEKYRIGVSLIDEQHEELFCRVSEFIQVVQRKGNWEEKVEKVKETMNFMQEYVIIHFDEEERYQEEIEYPDLEDHKEAHRNFKEAIMNYIRRFEEEGLEQELVQEFSGKLMTWLIVHVAQRDQQIGQYLKTEGGNAS